MGWSRWGGGGEQVTFERISWPLEDKIVYMSGLCVRNYKWALGKVEAKLIFPSRAV